MPEDLTLSAGPVRANAADLLGTPLSPPGYELGEEIGHGGMGVVYRARDVVLDRDVAVKLLSERYSADSPAAQRFLSEARITGQLQHPGIPAVHQVGTLADGRPFLAMKLIRGRTLDAILKQRTDPAAERGRLLAIFEAVCQAVGYAHAHRVIHRDLKPANLMVGAFGEVQVMDWGLAKVLGEQTPGAVAAPAAEETRAWTRVGPTPEVGSHTETGSLVGTPAYIPPEQAVGQLDRVNERSDVFGLGALLAVILTGQPPYSGESSESVRVQSVRGKLEECFARLDATGAEPELVALCKRCLAFEPADRPADAGAVAASVAELRAAADERARRAELDKVRVEGEKAAAEARALERRKRRRLVMGAAAVLALAVVGGLSAVLAVQRRANADLEEKNTALAAEQAKVEARFELAQKAIALFHTGVSEDFLLKNKEFEGLRTKLLKEAADFYADLERLLAGKTDAKSRKALAAAYFQLGELTDKIGDKKEALAGHQKALGLRRELAAAPESDAETRLDAARSLQAVSLLLKATGDPAGALAACEEQLDLAKALATDSPTVSVLSLLATSYNNLGNLQSDAGKSEQALATHQQARLLRQQLVDANPTLTQCRSDLAASYNNIGLELAKIRQAEKALAAHEKARDIKEQLLEANPTSLQFLNDLAMSHFNLAIVLSDMGKSQESLTSWERARVSYQQLAETNPAVTKFQGNLASCYTGIGRMLGVQGNAEKALAAYEKACGIWQRLTEANPTVTQWQADLATGYNNLGGRLAESGRQEEALVVFEKARIIQQKLVDANPTIPSYRSGFAMTCINLGYLHAHLKHFKESFVVLDAAQSTLQKLVNDNPKNKQYSIFLGYACAYRGWSRTRYGQTIEAARDLRQALEYLAKDPVIDADSRFEKAHAYALLAGLAKDAKSGVTIEEAATFADQAVASLKDAIKAGWARRDELKEPDFDPLRGRDDFKKLQAEVEGGKR
jgi:tetratricopeptide (TPR) repeat protein